MSPASEIVARYQAKGLTGADLRKAVERHVRLLSVFDPRVATELLGRKLSAESSRERHLKTWRKWRERRKRARG